MPNKDRTGPMGQGPLTGRGLGPCERGYGRGLGRGYGYRNFANIELTKEQEKKLLESRKQDIEEAIKELEQEKQEIEKKLQEID